jgi:hypothetical protein
VTTYGPMIAGILAAGASAATIFSLLKPEPTPPPAPPPARQALLWGPADCNKPEPMVAVGSCSNLVSLNWLRGKMHLLRAARVPGFAELPEDFLLSTAEYHGRPNWLLYATARGERLSLIGVGYNAEKQSKDGALRLYPAQGGKAISPAAQPDVDGGWWLRQPAEDWRLLNERF